MAMLITLVVLLAVQSGYGAPKSKNTQRTSGPQTVYDQKQTGDYNIQLHLKDFQIIALLGDDSAFGDYDYNYDYADFTVKPSTQKPSTEAQPSPSQPQQTTPPPEGKPSVTSKPISTLKPNKTVSNAAIPPQESQSQSLSPKEPLLHPKPTQQEANSSKVDNTPDTANVTEEVVQIVESSTPAVQQGDKVEETNSPGKIKVQIIETPVGIVPGEATGGAGSHGEVLQYRKCAQGFTRDKKGRCRRFRRPAGVSPHLQFGISRLASNLASRFRYSSADDTTSTHSED